MGWSARLAQSGVLSGGTKRCWKCGSAFTCAANAPGCWCEEYPPLKPMEGKDCLCPDCLAAAAKPPATARPLTEGEDYYLEGAAVVFTAAYHLRRGYCCGSGCRHCPYREATPPSRARC